MSNGGLNPRDARRVIEARLAREPQDMLEAAVVLEAWAGLPAQAALETASRLMHELPAPAAHASAGRPPAPPQRRGSLLQAVAFVLTTLAIASWAQPLASELGTDVVERAVRVALPLTLAIQWLLQSRYLGRPGGLVHLGRIRPALGAAVCALVALPSAVLGLAGLVTGLLTLTWVCGSVLLRRRWVGAYAAYMLLGTAEMHAGLPALPVLGGMAATAVAAAAMALYGRAPATVSPPGHAGRAVGAAAAGAGLGLLLVIDTSVTWTGGAVPALALLPASVGGLWAGTHLELLTEGILHSVTGVPVGASEFRGLTAAPVQLLAGAVWRLAVATAGISAVLLLLTPWLGPSATATPVMAGFGLVALTMLLVGVLLSAGRTHVALVAVACAVAVEGLITGLGASFPGAALLIASAVAVALLLPAAIALLRRPAQMLATSLWIA